MNPSNVCVVKVFGRIGVCVHTSVRWGLTCAGHGAGVGLGAVEAPLTHTLGGLVLVGVTVRGALYTVGIHCRGLVEPRAACCNTKHTTQR